MDKVREEVLLCLHSWGRMWPSEGEMKHFVSVLALSAVGILSTEVILHSLPQNEEQELKKIITSGQLISELVPKILLSKNRALTRSS